MKILCIAYRDWALEIYTVLDKSFQDHEFIIINSKKSRLAIRKSEKLIRGQGRMLVRKSGTEPKIRIMGESNNIKLLRKCINIVKRSIN